MRLRLGLSIAVRGLVIGGLDWLGPTGIHSGILSGDEPGWYEPRQATNPSVNKGLLTFPWVA